MKKSMLLSSFWHPKYQSRYYFSKQVLHEVEIWSWRHKPKKLYRMRCCQHHQVAGHLIPKLNRHFIFAHYLENNQYSNSPALQLVPNRFHHNAGFFIIILQIAHSRVAALHLLWSKNKIDSHIHIHKTRKEIKEKRCLKSCRYSRQSKGIILFENFSFRVRIHQVLFRLSEVLLIILLGPWLYHKMLPYCSACKKSCTWLD